MNEPKVHNYIPLLLKLFVEGKIKGFNDVDIRHDDDCSIFNGGYCDCEPDIVIRKDSSQSSRKVRKNRAR